MKSIHLRLFVLFLLLVITNNLFSQDVQKINELMFKQLDTMKNIQSKKIIKKHYQNGGLREIGVYMRRAESKRKISGFIGYHLNYYKNGNIKDSVFFDINTRLSGIGKGYFEDGKLRYVAIGRDVSIEDGLRYSKYRTGLCDSYNLYYYRNGNIGSEFGVNLRGKHFGDIVICAIDYNEDGTIKNFEQKSQK